MYAGWLVRGNLGLEKKEERMMPHGRLMRFTCLIGTEFLFVFCCVYVCMCVLHMTGWGGGGASGLVIFLFLYSFVQI